MSEHTPGPWEWVQFSDYWQLMSGDAVIADDGSAGGEYGETIDPRGANARLIAAAPDLLAACEAYIASITLGPREQYRQEDMLDSMMRAAIRKAKGE